MGFEIQDLKKILEIKEKHQLKWAKVAILGDCKFHFTWREVSPIRSGTFNLKDFQELLGAEEVQTFDLFGNPTIVQDLHEKIDPRFENYFDVVFDAGTMFCCFDVAAVWRNIFRLIKSDGCVWHLAGLAGQFGRGYYNFQPMLFRDFYTTNKFEFLNMSVRSKSFPSNRTFFIFKNRKQEIDWVDIDNNDVFYLGFDKNGRSLWGKSFKGNPSYILTDTLISCMVRCSGKKEFLNAIPPFFKP